MVIKKKDGVKNTKRVTATQRLLHLSRGREKIRQEYISSWLREVGINEIETEFPTDSGPVDLYLVNRRILIEVKSKNRLKNGPDVPGTGSRSNETAVQQISRYVESERKQERFWLGGENEIKNFSWVGMITDGEKWWLWEWLDKNSNKVPIERWQNTKLNETNIKSLKKIITRGKVGKDWIPANPSDLFEDVLKELNELYKRVKDYPSTNTQKNLWLEQLKGSGNAPTVDIDKMFVVHTLLILISRMVSNTINKYQHDNNEDDIVEGFVGWVVSIDDKVFKKLKSIINEYEWSRRSGDVLRKLYGHFIKEKHRKIFGEYYTPDWLAEKLCLEIIDNTFINKQIQTFQKSGGKAISCILDPTCGSGTFLYSAARRILESEPLEKSFMSDELKTSFVSSMIYGMDIHPVAVEMARANMFRILPKALKSNINIYQGDSLLTQRSDATVHSNGGNNMVLSSPAGTQIIIPKEFLKNVRDIDIFVKSANADAKMPPGLGEQLDKNSKLQLKDAHRALREIIIKEADGVWYWYIRNQAAPALLKDKKVGRIVSNPPWVTLQEIQNIPRKKEIKLMAQAEKLWVGKETAPRFDIAGLFVKKCMALYLEGNKSAWVLPQGAAISGKNWEGFRKVMDGKIANFCDMKRLPFPWTPTCVAITGSGDGEITETYVKKPKTTIKDGDRWASVKTKIKKIKRKTFVIAKSNWFDENGNLPVKHGASLQPAPLVRIDEITDVTEKNISFKTYATYKKPWNILESLSGTVPSEFVHDTVISTYIFPFIAKYNKSIIPILGNEWISDRNKNKYWRDASALYHKHRGVGDHSAKTLEESINHNDKLTKQLGAAQLSKKYKVVYNAVGDKLYAARLKPGVIGGVGVCIVTTKTHSESLFLVGLLNAKCLLGAYLSTRKSDRNFHLHFWNALPIPRYDKTDQDHNKLVKIVQKAELVASKVKLTDCPLKNKEAIRIALKDVFDEMDSVVQRILPEYVELSEYVG